jgi:Sporulation and spore germination
MPRRFALALLTLLVLLLLALLAGRRLRSISPSLYRGSTVPTAQPTPAIPPTPIPARRVVLFFESGDDERFHPELRDVPSSLDEAGFLRSIAAAVMEGPRSAQLLAPFPAGWTVRGAYRLKAGLAVIDLSPAALPPGPGAPAPAVSPRWETGSHEEESAAQALVLSIVKNIPDVNRVFFVLSGEPADTLAGHLDLTHPLRPDVARTVQETPLEPGTPAAVPVPSAPVPDLGIPGGPIAALTPGPAVALPPPPGSPLPTAAATPLPLAPPRTPRAPRARADSA